MPNEHFLHLIARHRILADRLLIHASLEDYWQFVNSRNNLLQAMVLVSFAHRMGRR